MKIYVFRHEKSLTCNCFVRFLTAFEMTIAALVRDVGVLRRQSRCKTPFSFPFASLSFRAKR